MQEIIKLHARDRKVRLVNRATLSLFRICPNVIREAGVYALFYALRGRLPKRRFVLFAQGRTGSTLLVDLMNSHPEVFMFGEILDAAVVKEVSSPRMWVEGLATLSRQPICGFKVKVYQLERHQGKDPSAVLKELLANGWKIVYLKRTNLLRHAISDLRSEKTRIFHNVSSSATKVGPIEISWDELQKAIRFRERCLAEEEAALSGLSHRLVEYEEDLLNEARQRTTMDALFDYIGAPPHEATTTFRKVTSRDIAADVANFGSLEQRIRSSEYERFLGWG